MPVLAVIFPKLRPWTKLEIGASVCKGILPSVVVVGSFGGIFCLAEQLWNFFEKIRKISAL